MPFEVERLENEPIISTKLIAPFDVENDVPAFYSAVDAAIKPQEEKVFVIYDIRQFNFSFTDMMTGMALSRTGIPGSASDPRLKIMVVGNQSLLQVGTESMKNDIYGNINVELFTDLDEALAGIRAQL